MGVQSGVSQGSLSLEGVSGASPPPVNGETEAQAGREAEIQMAQVKAGHACSGMLFGSASLGVSLSLGYGSMNQPQRHLLGQSHPFPTGGHLCPFVPEDGASKLSSASLLSPLWAGAQGWPYAGGGSERSHRSTSFSTKTKSGALHSEMGSKALPPPCPR